MTGQQQRKGRTKSQYVAVGILIAFLMFTSGWVTWYLYGWNNANNDLQKARTFHIVFDYYFSGQFGTPAGSIPDIQVDLTVHYPHGTLIVDDPVTMLGIAVLNTSIPQHVKSVTVHFQNALAFPVTQDSNNITQGVDIILDPTQNSSVLAGNVTMLWALEGTYNPYFIAVYENAAGRFATPAGISPDVAITVYPKAQFAQLENNNVSMILTIAVYLLTLIGTFSLILSILDRHLLSQEPSSQENQNSDKAINTHANATDDNPDKRIDRKCNHKETIRKEEAR